jgi:hypothetical protein
MASTAFSFPLVEFAVVSAMIASAVIAASRTPSPVTNAIVGLRFSTTN